MREIDDKYIDSLTNKINKQRTKRKRKTEENSAFQSVFDKFTYETIEKLRKKGHIAKFVGILSAGKEANVYFGRDPEDNPLAIKIYKIDPHNTRWMKNYIIGDPRFHKIGTSTHKIIYTWCKKEFKNLKRLEKRNIDAPKPFSLMKNVLVMEFIGDKNGTPAPRLKDVANIRDPLKEFKTTISLIERIFLDAKLIHADLSEYNILYLDKKQYIIDISQGVSIEHPNAIFFLKRDITNVMNFFKNFINPEIFRDPEDLARDIFIKSNL